MVWTAGSAADPPGPAMATAGAGWRHPAVVCALQREASITEMSLSTWFAVYSVWVWLSSTIPSGSAPVWIVGGPQCRAG